MSNIKFSSLLNQYQQNSKVLALIFYLSKNVKDLDTYYLYRDTDIDFSYSVFESLLKKSESVPIERVIGECVFKKHTFAVFNGVFIPRWETEQIIDIVHNLIKDVKEPISLIDICSGTGVIGITLCLEMNERIKSLCCLDISKEACKNILFNLEKHHVDGFIINKDWFTHLEIGKYELITANFPYVDVDDPIDENLCDIEPVEALFGKDQGWEHYQKLLVFLQSNNHWKYVVLECSEFHQERWERVKLDKTQWNVEFYKDLNGKFRFVSITRA